MPKSHERLHVIAGRWATDGHVVGDPSMPVKGFDTYDVLAGGYFLVHHVDVTVGDQPVQAIEVIGERDPDSGGFLARSFDNSGNCEVMRVTVDDASVFRFTGGPEVAAAARPFGATTVRVRSTLTLLRRQLDDGAVGAVSRWTHLGAVDADLVHKSVTDGAQRRGQARRLQSTVHAQSEPVGERFHAARGSFCCGCGLVRSAPSAGGAGPHSTGGPTAVS